MKLSRKQLTYQATARLGEGVIVLVFLVISILLSRQISTVRREVAQERQVLEASLAGAVEQGMLQSELERRQHDVDRLIGMIVKQEEMDALIGTLEEEARANQVQMTIPSLERETVVKGKKEAAAGANETARFEEVRLRIVAHGKAANLLNFWHAVENLPFLTGVIEYNFFGQERQAVPGSATRQPATNPPGETVTPVEQPEASLELVTLVSVWPQP